MAAPPRSRVATPTSRRAATRRTSAAWRPGDTPGQTGDRSGGARRSAHRAADLVAHCLTSRVGRAPEPSRLLRDEVAAALEPLAAASARLRREIASVPADVVGDIASPIGEIFPG